MNFHRNSQKRIYVPGLPVFITTNTYQRFEYFLEDIFCHLLVEEINYAKKIKNFALIAFKINPDHVHMVIQPGTDFNYSNIMQFIKKHTARNANLIMNTTLTQKTDDTFPPVEILKKQFINKHGKQNPFPQFKWQKSFHSHIISSEEELNRIKNYIIHQKEKHQLPGNTFLYINE